MIFRSSKQPQSGRTQEHPFSVKLTTHMEEKPLDIVMYWIRNVGNGQEIRTEMI